MSAGPMNAIRTAVVTGATGTLGGQIALALAGRGVTVAAFGRAADRLAALRQRAGAGIAPRIVPFALDVTDVGAVRAAMDQVCSDLGPPQALVTAAGIYGTVGDVAATAPERWRQAIDVNLMGVYNFCHFILPHMIAAGGGSIVNLAGGGASGPLDHLSSYGVSKAAIVRLTDSLAAEAAPAGIRANAVLPGPVDSPMQDQLLSAGDKAGHWFEKIRALREKGEGGVAPERTVALLDFLLFGRGKALSGRLLSARYDRFESWSDDQIAQIAASPLYSLRRIDPATVLAVMQVPAIREL